MKNLLSILLIINYHFAFSQEKKYPQDYFAPPMDIPLYLSGNFGEIRTNHFHAGIDIKTQGVEGIPIKSAAEGFVSRIKISPYGYGKAIYVVHPNGYTTVYGHIQKFSETIEKYIKAAQYKKESFSIELFPMSSELQVKKGDLIAYSGNTGGSGGPHLHFEIRETKSETPLNVMLFGFDIKDNISPIVQSIYAYPLDDTSTVNGSHSKMRFPATGSNGNYRLLVNAIQAYGRIGFGIETIDQANGVGNRIGVYKIDLKENDQLVYSHIIDGIPFNKSRFMNAHIDYEEKVKTGRAVQRSFVLDNNQLDIYQLDKKSGPITINNGEQTAMKYELKDAYGNASEISFSVAGKKTSSASRNASIKSSENRYFNFNRRSVILEDDILVNIPAYYLYEDLEFEFSKESNSRCISPLYNLHNKYTPLHSYMNISIKMEGLSDRLKEKSLIVSTTNKRSFSAEGGKWNGDNLNAKSRTFGSYCIMVDSTPPVIIPVNISNGANMNGKWSIMIKATDNLSGIDYYRGEVDGKWILFEYDYKRNLFFHYFDGTIDKGNHTLTFEVKDGTNNSSKIELKFNN